MMKFRRIGAMVAATVAATAMAMTVATAPAAAAPKGPSPISTFLLTTNENSGRWVSVLFKTDVKVCNFKLKVTGWGNVDVYHPGLKPYTSLWQNDTLNKNEVDYASFYVKVGDYSASKWQLLPAVMTYSKCAKKAKTQIKYTGFLLPVKVV